MIYKDLLVKKLSKKELSLAKRSFDIVGDIAVLEIPKELTRKQKLIGQALLKVHKNIKVVCKKMEKTKGKERIRRVRVIAGKRRTRTIHTEHGCRYELDLNKVFFTPRLSNERLRILHLTKPGEVIIDMFAGVGPFSILLAKKKGVKVHAIDINKAAIKYLKKNIKLNKVENLVTPYLGNSKTIVKKYKLMGDRIIMNLPERAYKFLDTAKRGLKRGGIIHLYGFSGKRDDIKRVIGKKLKILRRVNCGGYAPGIDRVCFDLKI